MTLHDQWLDVDRHEHRARRAAERADDTPQFDSIIELGIDDDAYGPAESWPSWTDDDRWEPGPEPLPYESDEPSPWPTDVEIEEYEAEHAGPTDADLDEMAKYCEWADRVEGMRRYTDDDLRAAGLPVG
jgi:hypothetical protein